MKAAMQVLYLFAFLCLTWVLQVGAHSGATGIVKERMDLMSGIGDASKNISEMVKRKRVFDAAEIHVLAEEIKNHAVRIPELFPDTQDSREGHATDALPAIWERWAEFAELAADLEKESAVLVEKAASGDEMSIRKQFIAVAKICKSCHTDFRRPQEDQGN